MTSNSSCYQAGILKTSGTEVIVVRGVQLLGSVLKYMGVHNKRNQFALAAQVPDGQTAARFVLRCCERLM